jgi:hypothetical protein
MQIRERGKTIRLIRTAYDTEAKAPVSEILAKVKLPDMALSDEDRAKFTAEELEEFEAFRSGKARSAILEREYAAKQLLANVELVSEWLSAAPREEAIALGAELQKPLKKLRRQIDSLSNTGDEPAAKRIKRNDVVQDDDGDDD